MTGDTTTTNINMDGDYFTIDSNNTITINEPTPFSFTNKEKEKLLLRLNELKTKIDDDTISMTDLYNFVKERTEMSSFISELHNDEYKDDFEADKNRLITLMVKNKNIHNKLNNSKMNFYISLGMLMMYAIGLVFIYVQTGMMELDMQATILIAISMCVLLFFVIYDVYTIATKKHYEGFQEVVNTNTVQEEVNKYIEILPGLVKIETKVLESDRSSQRHEIVKNILHDFNNLNYINMRQYQLTDYKINETRNRLHFVKN